MSPAGQKVSRMLLGKSRGQLLIVPEIVKQKRPIEKDPDDGKYWRQKEKGVAEDEMVRSHLPLNVRVWASSGR